ncbi:hypothetical protein [Anabaena catenula]|uniref:Methyltransferase domain-containing protein n=1 Tax=Anabaena catenula FACHB-362 TaxID=2692877 RepID=A0ABR8JAI3_9NOST|nr:hypothetical protein [Anabaena catenula]MBD2694467.1 hypothetical protein [Anabaena catenula FACHB-362]
MTETTRPAVGQRPTGLGRPTSVPEETTRPAVGQRPTGLGRPTSVPEETTRPPVGQRPTGSGRPTSVPEETTRPPVGQRPTGSGRPTPVPNDIKECFEKFVKHFYDNHIETDAWVKEILNQTVGYHRKTILERGVTDFCVPFNELNTDDKVLLYCHYYMLMHVMSSYDIFKTHWIWFKNKISPSFPPLLIDFGCGPLSSGLAFAHVQEPKINFNYIGIDRAKSMRIKAKQFSSDQRFSGCKFDFLESYDNDTLLSSMSKYRLLNHPSQLVILNFSYFFASKSLDVNELVITIKNILTKYNRTQVYIVFQNPNTPERDINSKWHEFIKSLPEFKTKISGPLTKYSKLWFPLTGVSLYYDLLEIERISL